MVAPLIPLAVTGTALSLADMVSNVVSLQKTRRSLITQTARQVEELGRQAVQERIFADIRAQERLGRLSAHIGTSNVAFAQGGIVGGSTVVIKQASDRVKAGRAQEVDRLATESALRTLENKRRFVLESLEKSQGDITLKQISHAVKFGANGIQTFQATKAGQEKAESSIVFDPIPMDSEDLEDQL